MKFEQHWPRSFRGGHLKLSTFFHTNFIPLPQGGSKWDLSIIGLEAPVEVFWNSEHFPIQMHKEANLSLPYKGQMSMNHHYFSNFGRPPVPDDLCKDSALRHPRFWRRRFLKGFHHIWAWRPSWSTDRDHFSNFSFLQTKKAPYKIWAKLAQGLQRRLFENVNGRSGARADSLTGGRTKSDHYSSSWASGELKRPTKVGIFYIF